MSSRLVQDSQNEQKKQRNKESKSACGLNPNLPEDSIGADAECEQREEANKDTDPVVTSDAGKS